MEQIGKIGKRNQQANKKLKELYIEKEITTCEVCNSDFGLSWHHRHKRAFYRDCLDKLSAFDETILLCAEHHAFYEGDREATELLFLDKRG